MPHLPAAPMPRLVALVVAAALAGCLPPPSSAIVKPGADPGLDVRTRPGAEAPASECALDGIRPRYELAVCEPEGFEALVRGLAPDRVVADRWDGREVSGRSVFARGDTLRLDGEALPFESLARVRLVDHPAPGRVARRLAITSATTAALGGLAGLGEGGPGFVDGALIGASAGLALGWMVGRIPAQEPFRVVGWADRWEPYLRLDTDGDGCAGVTLAGGLAPYSSTVPCVTAAAFEERAERSWVERIDVELRSGALGGAAVGALFGVIGAALVPSDAVRETAVLPTPEP